MAENVDCSVAVPLLAATQCQLLRHQDARHVVLASLATLYHLRATLLRHTIKGTRQYQLLQEAEQLTRLLLVFLQLEAVQ